MKDNHMDDMAGAHLVVRNVYNDFLLFFSLYEKYLFSNSLHCNSYVSHPSILNEINFLLLLSAKLNDRINFHNKRVYGLSACPE